MGELAFGAAKSGRRNEAHAALAEFLLALEIASFDSDAASSYGLLRASFEKRGTPIGPLDTLIAAHAAALDVILVTHNTREFSRIDTHATVIQPARIKTHRLEHRILRGYDADLLLWPDCKRPHDYYW